MEEVLGMGRQQRHTKRMAWAGSWLGILVLVQAFLSTAVAGEPLEQVKVTLEAASAILGDPKLAGPEKEGERREAIKKVIFDHFDLREMAARSLGDQWAKLTSSQQEEFVRVFGDLFQRSYTRLVLKFLPERRTLYGQEKLDGSTALVKTTLVSQRNERLPVDYRLIKKGSQWAFFDVIIDGVSIVGNYRTQFSKIIRSSSYESLVRRMKLKQEQESF